MKKHGFGSGLLQLIDKKSFKNLVDKWEMDKGVKSLLTWELTCALVSCMVARLSSYREAELATKIPRSTLADALGTRSYGFFQELCDQIFLAIQARTTDRKVKRAIRKILAIDSTDVKVHGSLFLNPAWRPLRFNGHQAAGKLHVVWDIEGQWVEDFRVTPLRSHDSPVSLQFSLQPKRTYVFDRAYNDMNFWLKIIDTGSHFVTRLKDCKKNRELRVEVLLQAKNHDGVLYDGAYQPSAPQQKLFRDRLKTKRIRHIIYRDPDTKKVFDFATSDFKSSAQAIADTYKQRWAVELLFRWLKGHLDIRYLALKNPNAIKGQLAIAVLIHLLVQLKKIIDQFQGTPWELLRKIRTTLVHQSLCRSRPPDGCRWSSAITRDFGHGLL